MTAKQIADYLKDITPDFSDIPDYSIKEILKSKKKFELKTLKVEDDHEKTNNWWYSIAAVVAVLLISIILILVRKLHKKNILLEEARKAASH